MRDDYQQLFDSIQKILVVIAHTDDLEMIFAGTAIRLLKDKKQVRLLVCTNGSVKNENQLNLSKPLSQIRTQEQFASAQIIGIPENEVFILPNPDCTLNDSDDNLNEKIVFHMRSFRPEIIVTHQFERIIEFIEPDFLWVAHKDHRAVGTATMNAIIPLASSKYFYPEHFEQGLKPIEVYKILIPDLVKGKVAIDINEVVDIKRQALRCHKSQMDDKYAEEIMDNHNIFLGQKDKKPYYFEKFRYYEFGYNPNRKDYEEKS